MDDRRRTHRNQPAVNAGDEVDRYQALEADAGDDTGIAAQARALRDLDASAVFDDDDAAPDTLRIETWAGEEITDEIALPPESERHPASNYDQARVWPPEDLEPTTDGYNFEDLDAEGDWPDE